MQPQYDNFAKNQPNPFQNQMYDQNQQPSYVQQGIPLNYYPEQNNNYNQQQLYAEQIQMNAKPNYIAPPPVIVKQNHSHNNQTNTHSHHPADVYCTNCNKNIITQIEYEIGLGTWTMVLLLLCCFWPLMCIPCCINSMKDVVHYCPNCGAFCGRKKFLC